METKTWHTMDKRTWGPGPWQDEPDKMQWPDSATGLPCLIKRNPVGALCGYVGVPVGHPWYGEHYREVHPDVQIHGGLTYSDACQEGDEGHTICHVPALGEPDHAWWLGFDCGHRGDYAPNGSSEMDFWNSLLGSEAGDGSYCDLAYVQAQCTALAGAAREAAL